MGNKTTTPTYVCPICGKKYNNVLERKRCEIKCSNKNNVPSNTQNETKNEAYATATKPEFKKNGNLIVKRKAEVDAAYEKYLKLKEKFEKDFGPYKYLEDDLVPNPGMQFFNEE
jgi:hypothetical protein